MLNSDPVLHGNNVRVPPRHGVNAATGEVLVSARVKGNDNERAEGVATEAEAGVVTPDAAANDAYAYQRRAEREAREAAAHAAHADWEASIGLGAGAAGRPGTSASSASAGLRSGLVSTHDYFDAAKQHKREQELTALARESYARSITGGGAGGLGLGLGIGLAAASSSRGLDADGDDAFDLDGGAAAGAGGGGGDASGRGGAAGASSTSVFGGVGGAGAGAGASTSSAMAAAAAAPKSARNLSNLSKSAREKQAEAAANRSISAQFAAEADPEGLLDRRLIKRLAAAMEGVEDRRRAAERAGGAATAKGRIDLQRAMARRASIARLMSGIASDAEAAFLNGGTGPHDPSKGSGGCDERDHVEAAIGAEAAAAGPGGGAGGGAGGGGGVDASPMRAGGLALYGRPKLR
jgi:hypothetical protein